MDLVLVSRRDLIVIVFDAPVYMEDRILSELRSHGALSCTNSVRNGWRRSARDEQKLVGSIDYARPN
ncbi:MAG: hypothetical protein J5U17_08605 [Candidatus Methanoperedens sp.]|nr:hypothetical protein [Candidatus Methanoperedens sp.]